MDVCDVRNVCMLCMRVCINVMYDTLGQVLYVCYVCKYGCCGMYVCVPSTQVTLFKYVMCVMYFMYEMGLWVYVMYVTLCAYGVVCLRTL